MERTDEKGANRMNLAKEKTERMWIQENEDINILNYWYYRYLTRRYMRWMQNRITYGV